ncbi:MAG: hypothetical protein HY554_14270 [Elusimicrobia bacterium]|nr:hypothetical protein [Elusimicrobiota bacterium]
MRYWLLRDKRAAGPFAPEELLGQPGFGKRSLLCPEGKSVKKRGNWKLATHYGEIAEALSPRRPPAEDARQPAPAEPTPAPEAGAAGNEIELTFDPERLGPADGVSIPVVSRSAPRAARLAWTAAALAAVGALIAIFPMPGPDTLLRSGSAPPGPAAPLQLFPRADAGRPVGEEELARLRARLGGLRLSTGAARLEESSGPGAAWTAWPLDQARYLVEVRGAPTASGQASPGIRLIYDSARRSAVAADPESATVLGEPPFAVP